MVPGAIALKPGIWVECLDEDMSLVTMAHRRRKMKAGISANITVYKVVGLAIS
jgi:hypothetical protein